MWGIEGSGGRLHGAAWKGSAGCAQPAAACRPPGVHPCLHTAPPAPPVPLRCCTARGPGWPGCTSCPPPSWWPSTSSTCSTRSSERQQQASQRAACRAATRHHGTAPAPVNVGRQMAATARRAAGAGLHNAPHGLQQPPLNPRPPRTSQPRAEPAEGCLSASRAPDLPLHPPLRSQPRTSHPSGRFISFAPRPFFSRARAAPARTARR